jgi:hypothetical protein
MVEPWSSLRVQGVGVRQLRVRGEEQGEMGTLSLCASAAATDAAFMRAMFPGEASEE